MTKTIRLLLFIEGSSFIVAALIHFGVFFESYAHQKAGTAETVISLVVFGGLILSLIRPQWTRKAGLAAQAFALLGTFVGVFTIAIGVGPRTLPDIVYHICIIILLISGLIVTARFNSGIEMSNQSYLKEKNSYEH